MKNYHFWYSKKQAAVLGSSFCSGGIPINYASINGGLVVYTTCSPTTDHGCFFDDMQYLGQGDYHTSNGQW